MRQLGIGRTLYPFNKVVFWIDRVISLAETAGIIEFQECYSLLRQ